MQFATPHPIKANKTALLALHRALYFDKQTDLSDAHISAANYISKVKGARAWGNSTTETGLAVTLSPMSGIKDNFFYPARSARLSNNTSVTGGYANYTAVQTPEAVLARYLTVYDVLAGTYTWTGSGPVFTGRSGRSADSSESYYWPSNCMLIFPAGMRAVNVNLQTYSSFGGKQYARAYDSFWGTYCGYDAGYNNASLSLASLSESRAVGYSYIDTTGSPIQMATLHNTDAALDHIVMLRTIGMTYSFSGLNQFSYMYTPQSGNGSAAYTRPAAAFPMRVAITGKTDTDDVVLTSCMMAFQVNGLKYLVRGEVGTGKDLTQAAAIPTATTATLTLASDQFFPQKMLTQM